MAQRSSPPEIGVGNGQVRGRSDSLVHAGVGGGGGAATRRPVAGAGNSYARERAGSGVVPPVRGDSLISVRLLTTGAGGQEGSGSGRRLRRGRSE